MAGVSKRYVSAMNLEDVANGIYGHVNLKVVLFLPHMLLPREVSVVIQIQYLFS